MTRLNRKRTALIAAALLLFSALSPAMASVLFSHRPDILARVLGVPAHHDAADAATGHGDGCPHEAAAAAHPGDANPQAHDTSEHAAHGIFCSFCLAAGSVVGVPAAAPVLAALLVSAAGFIPAGAVQPPAANLRLTRHPRDPPVILC